MYHDCRTSPYFDSVSIFKFADGIFICDLFIAEFHSVTPVKRPNVILSRKKTIVTKSYIIQCQ